MIISAAIVSQDGKVFYSNSMPSYLKRGIANHTKDFLYSLSVEDDQIELPYIETTSLRYIYKQTEDLYWLLVTKLESDMFNDIKLLGKFVCTIMEYGALETTSTTLTDEQRDLFYRHIWRPWDEGSQCPFCNCHCGTPELWQREFESRLQFLISIRDGNIDDNEAFYFAGLVNEAWTINAKLTPRWISGQQDCPNSDSDSLCSCTSDAQSISEENLIDGCRLKCRLEDIRLELNRLQDPYLRLFARRDLLPEYNGNGRQMSSAPLFKELDSDAQSSSDYYQSSSM